jgi:very-long-chain enoyl-CoA reductase
MVTVEDRNGRSLGEYSLSFNATVGDMKKELCAKKPKYYPERQWYTVDTAQGTALKKDEMALKEFAKEGKLKLIFKDLGAQISWSTVFMVEYFGTRAA